MPLSNGEKPAHETVMDVTVEQIARVYARAFVGVIEKLSEPGELVSELKSLVSDVLDRFPKLEQTLESSLVSAEQKEQLLDRVFGKAASPQVLNFLKVVSRHGRLELLRPVARQVEKLHSERSGLTDVEVRVATELDDAVRDDIQLRLQKALGTQPVLNVKIDPSIIAGIVVRVGDRVFDGSLYTQLEYARKAMIDRATEQIETKPDRFLSAG
jgi:F-type H+-transporting ATPase subunit delta